MKEAYFNITREYKPREQNKNNDVDLGQQTLF